MIIVGIQVNIGDRLVYKYKIERGCNCRNTVLERQMTIVVNNEGDIEVLKKLVSSVNFIALEHAK